MTCPRLTRQIDALLAIYTHLEPDDLWQMRHYHSCPEYRPRTDRHLSRDLEDE